MPDRYFELLDHIGVDAAGNSEPLTAVGTSIPVSILHEGELLTEPRHEGIKPAEILPDGAGARIIPDTRIVEVRDPRIAHQLIGCGHYREIDLPTDAALRKAVDATAAHRSIAAVDEGALLQLPRGELDSIAAAKGVAEPEKLANKSVVIDAIRKV